MNNIKGQVLFSLILLIIGGAISHFYESEINKCSVKTYGVIDKVDKFSGKYYYDYHFYVNSEKKEASQILYTSLFIKKGDTISIKYACNNIDNSEIIIKTED